MHPGHKAPRKVDDRKLEEHEPQTARKEETRDLRYRLSPARGQECAGSSEESEHRRAEVSDDAGKEERRVRMREILGGKPRKTHEVTGVIQGHEEHGEPPQDIDGNQPWSLRGEK